MSFSWDKSVPVKTSFQSSSVRHGRKDVYNHYHSTTAEGDQAEVVDEDVAECATSGTDYRGPRKSLNHRDGRKHRLQMFATSTADKENVTPTGKRNNNNQQHFIPATSSSRSKKKHKRTASLTDLRPEDKKKVANLIQELANLGSEKERIESCLKSERQDFEQAIRDLVSDQKVLLSERQAVQSELQSCQQMLSQLQEAVLHRPSSTTSSQQSDNVARNNGHIVTLSNHKKADFGHHSELDAYITKHNTTRDMDTTSELGSITSEAAKNPRTSSTIIDDVNPQRRGRGGLQTEGSLHDVSGSTIDYSKKDEIFLERARLIEEQRLLRQRLLQQEDLLRITQQRLYLREHQLTRSQQWEMDGGRERDINATFTKESTQQSSHRLRDVSCDAAANSSYDIGVQVSEADVANRSNRQMQDNAVQTELPVQTRQAAAVDRSVSQTPDRTYIGKRLVPSPSDCTSRSNTSIQEAIEKTNRLLESAKRVIKDAKSPRSTTSRSQLSRLSPSVCSHSYQVHTPRKTSGDLFDVEDTSLATDINSCSALLEEVGEADRTEIELLEDIFYIK